jgi:hypothetical protein
MLNNIEMGTDKNNNERVYLTAHQGFPSRMQQKEMAVCWVIVEDGSTGSRGLCRSLVVATIT